MSGGTHITGDNIPAMHTEKLRPFITVAMATNCTLNAHNSLKNTYISKKLSQSYKKQLKTIPSEYYMQQY